MHLVFRLADTPLRIIDPGGGDSVQPVGSAMVAGARSRFYVREFSGRSASVGALLRPGAAAALFGADAAELAERHTLLADLWGRSAQDLHDLLRESAGADRRLAIFERALSRRLRRSDAERPAIASVIDALPGLQDIGAAASMSGLSHRHFIKHFRSAVGLGPKTYSRILRFRKAVELMRSESRLGLAALASAAGYSDQPHFSRDFLAFAGTTPTDFLARRTANDRHVPMNGEGNPSSRGQFSPRPATRSRG